MPADPFAASLPALAFGDAGAPVDADLAAFTDRMSSVVTALRSYDPVGPPAAFSQKSAAIAINGLKLAAGASTPVRVQVGESTDATLLIPFAGAATSVVDGVTHAWRAGERAMFLPGVGGSGETSIRSVLAVDLRAERLHAVTRSMLGLAPDAPVELLLGRARTVDLRAGGMAFDSVFTHLCGLIDAYRAQVEPLEALGLDDQFLRHVVMLLRPGIAAAEVMRREPRARRTLDPACDYIMAHLEAPLSLSDLERVSGLSRRSLQYAFWQRHECTPMQWVREQRLARARALLLAATPTDSVTSVSLACGFANLGAFSGHYLERFGEYPSETLRQAAARR
jgi:AraC-like DNA-binding protein